MFYLPAAVGVDCLVLIMRVRLHSAIKSIWHFPALSKRVYFFQEHIYAHSTRATRGMQGVSIFYFLYVVERLLLRSASYHLRYPPSCKASYFALRATTDKMADKRFWMHRKCKV
jgi:hypothetical protein